MRPNVSDISGRNNSFGSFVVGVLNNQFHPDAAPAAAGRSFFCVGECDADDVFGQDGGVWAGYSVVCGVDGATGWAAGRCADVEFELAVIEIEERVSVGEACWSEHTGGEVGAPISEFDGLSGQDFIRIEQIDWRRGGEGAAGNLVHIVTILVGGIFVGFTAYCAEGNRCSYRVELGRSVSGFVCLVPALISALDQHGNREHNNTAEGYCHH